MIGRRSVLALAACALAAPFAGLAQRERTIRIGHLAAGGPTPTIAALVAALRDLGYVEGKNVSFERRFADGKLDQLPGFAAELARLGVDVIITTGTPATIEAKKATRTIPIVFAANSDPVGVGLVASLARPGGNVTGTSLMASDLSAKRLELLQTLVPRISRIAILWDASNPGMALRVRETEAAAVQSRVLLRSAGSRNLEELEAVFAELAKEPPDALLVTVEPFTRRHLPRILEFCRNHRVPSMFEDASYVEAGGLVSYGPDVLEVYRRAATYIDMILKGAKPADLPVELPTKIDLVVNLRTAGALGLAVPQTLLLRADRVIE